MNSLAGRTALVTGGGTGLGAAISRHLHAEGVRVVVAGRRSEPLQRLAGELGTGIRAEVCHVADPESVADLARRLRGEQVSILINNAGIAGPVAPLIEIDPDAWDEVFATNVRGTFLMCRAVAPHMRAAKYGRIVNLSSTGALGAPGLASYGAAKAGVQGLTKTIAFELGRHGVTANVIAPGFIVTAMTAGMAERTGTSFEDMQREMLREIPVGRVGQPEDIANAVAFFVDERSGYVTGQILYVTGGQKL